MSQWHCSIGGQKYGPISEADVKQWIAEGRLSSLDLVWTDGMAEWASVSQVPSLSGGVAPAGFPPPVSPPGLPPVAQQAVKRVRQVEAPGAKASMICGIIGLFCFGIVLGPIALIMGLGAKSKIKQSPEKYTGDGMATAGIVLGIIGIAGGIINIIFVIPMLSKL